MRAIVSSLLALVAAVVLSDAGSAQASLALGTRGDRITVDGEPRFLVLVSYFDALDAARLDDDLAWIASRADGIRIFADWWDYDRSRRCRTRFSDRTLLEARPDGAIGVRPDRLARLKQVLDRARSAGLVVDLTFSYETVRGASNLRANAQGDVCGSSTDLKNRVRLSAYARALGEVATALAGAAYRHVFFDLQNEWNGGWTRLTAVELTALADAVRRYDPDRLLSASAYDPRPDRLVEAARAAKLQIVAYHDWPRSRGWPDRVAPAVRGLKRALSAAAADLPVIAGEPPPDTYGEGPTAYRRALDAARDAGAAAWTFHTRAGFRLDDRAFPDLLDDEARAFLDGLAEEGRQGAVGHFPHVFLGVD
jgi:hypothetical protein